MKKENFAALLPIGVFLVLYLGLGITFEYVMKIPMGFYNIPIVVAFLIASTLSKCSNSICLRFLPIPSIVSSLDDNRLSVIKYATNPPIVINSEWAKLIIFTIP